MNRISVVIITFNEQANIARCIRSLLPVADEILISDSFSTDETAAIAEKLGATVLLHPFTGYGATKNNANNQAQYDWILSVDADEALDDELARQILALKNNLAPDTAYEFQRLNNYCGTWIRHGGWYPDRKVRLFNRHTIKWNLAEVHETLEIPASTQIVPLRGKLLHYSYSSVQSHLKKIDIYSERGAQEAFKKGKRATFIKRYLSPLFRFVRDYFLKRGFLDGAYGFTIARLTAKEVYLKYKKLSLL